MNKPIETGEKRWIDTVIKEEEINKYLIKGKDFIDEEKIYKELEENKNPGKSRIKEIIAKALEIERLNPDETAALLHVKDEELWHEIFEAGGKIKKTVYDNRIVTFAPLYCSNLCVNNCTYCGFRKSNQGEKRRILTLDEVKKEAESLAGGGHKRLIVVYGEHSKSDADYIAETIKVIYDTKVKARKGYGSIRRVNINAAPMSIEDLKKLWKVGVGTYQVFQETYHKTRYREVHPGTLKANYRWRLYALHRAMDAGIDDVATGALFGLYDWRFEVMGLLYHAIDLEHHFNIGPHTVSFPRLNPADGAVIDVNGKYQVDDTTFKRLVAVLRLSIPYTGMIITARENAQVRRDVIPVGCTQTDASTKIGVGSYSEDYPEQQSSRQQFMLGDTRSLNELITEFANNGTITSFCTAGYRCGRTGDKIMGLLKKGHEGRFCKLNAILTFREWLDDFGTPGAVAAGEKVIKKEFEEVKKEAFYKDKKLIPMLEKLYKRICDGERDLFL